MMLDYEEAAQEFLRALRGKRSQIAFARRLGYRANPITDWENGRRFPTARETLRAATLIGISVEAGFANFAPLTPPSDCDNSLAVWLNALRGTRSISELAEYAQRSRYAVSRWLSGKTEPRLPDFLRLLDVITGRVHDWVNEIVPIEEVPTLMERFAQVQAARRLAFEKPWSEAVLRVLETRHYLLLKEHSDRYVAQLLGIQASEVKGLLGEFMLARIVEKDKNKYRVIDSLTVDTSSTRDEVQGVRKHWAQVGVDRLFGDHENDWFAYNVIAVSKKDSERIEQRLRAAYREVRSIVAESEKPEMAAVLTMQLVRW